LKLKPGMTANLTMTIAERNDVLKVPNAAMRFRPQGMTPDKIRELFRGAGGDRGAGNASRGAGKDAGASKDASAPQNADGKNAGGPKGREEKGGGGRRGRQGNADSNQARVGQQKGAGDGGGRRRGEGGKGGGEAGSAAAKPDVANNRPASPTAPVLEG